MPFGLGDSCFDGLFFSTAKGSIARGSDAVFAVGDGARGAVAGAAVAGAEEPVELVADGATEEDRA